NERDAIVGVAFAESEEAIAEAERKDENADPKKLRDEEVPRLVREDQEAEDEDEGDEVGGDVRGDHRRVKSAPYCNINSACFVPGPFIPAQSLVHGVDF